MRRTGVLISRCLLCAHVRSCLTCGTIGGALGHRGIGIMSTKYGKMERNPESSYEENLEFLRDWLRQRNQWILDNLP